jgi:hypothetical protein
MLAALVQAGLLGYALINAFWAPTPTILDLPYSDFLTQVADGNVAWVSMDDAAGLHIEGAQRQAITVQDQTPPYRSQTSDRFRTINPFKDDSALKAELSAHGVHVHDASAPTSQPSSWPGVLLGALLLVGAVVSAAAGVWALIAGALHHSETRR